MRLDFLCSLFVCVLTQAVCEISVRDQTDKQKTKHVTAIRTDFTVQADNDKKQNYALLIVTVEPENVTYNTIKNGPILTNMILLKKSESLSKVSFCQNSSIFHHVMPPMFTLCFVVGQSVV